MPLTNQQKSEVARFKMTSQIITGALMAGIFFFMLLVVFLSLEKELRWGVDVLEIVGLMLGFGNLIAALFVVPIFQAQQINQMQPTSSENKGQNSKASELDDSFVKSVLQRDQTKTIIRFALLEGAAIFNLIAFLRDQGVVSLIMTGVIVLGMMAIFPRAGHFERLFEDLSR